MSWDASRLKERGFNMSIDDVAGKICLSLSLGTLPLRVFVWGAAGWVTQVGQVAGWVWRGLALG